MRDKVCSILALASLLAGAAASDSSRPVLDGAGDCAGVSGRYLASLRDGRATVVSAAAFPGGRSAASAADDPVTSAGELWRATIPGFAPEAAGCVAFDKDLFTWPGDLVTYIQYLVREVLIPARRLDPALRTLAVKERTVRLRVEREGRDYAILSGPEGAMLGYGKPGDEERYLFLPVLLDDGETALVRILRNEGSAFGERATSPVGALLLRGDAWATSDAAPGFRLRRLLEPIGE